MLFRRDAYESLATVFLLQGHALAIDALATNNDA
jgi:hypothetical protein